MKKCVKNMLLLPALTNFSGFLSPNHSLFLPPLHKNRKLLHDEQLSNLMKTYLYRRYPKIGFRPFMDNQ